MKNILKDNWGRLILCVYIFFSMVKTGFNVLGCIAILLNIANIVNRARKEL